MRSTFLNINRLAAKRLLEFLLLIFLVLVSRPPTAQAAELSVNLAGMDVTVWSQETDRNIKQPVIIFSHGFHGCATQSRFLMEAFASAGYLVFAPNHRDAICNGGKAKWIDRPQMPFRKPQAWNESSFLDRADDIRRLIEAIRTDDRFRQRVDWSRLGLAGHSLGGYTVLALGGAWPGWKLSNVKAVLALSPYTQPFLLQNTLAGLSAPVMYQGGTWDYGVTPALHKAMGAYDQSSEPKYYVEFDRMGHFGWTDFGRRKARKAIIAYSLTFMNYYVKGEPPAPSLTEPLPGVARFRYASELGNSGR
jgi:pimeloyl-ACP methyl ester carboxylesterase